MTAAHGHESSPGVNDPKAEARFHPPEKTESAATSINEQRTAVSPQTDATLQSEAASQQTHHAAVFPVATIRDEAALTSSLFLRSRLWWVTLFCLVLAFWLTWRSIPSKGPTITIRFPDGHGIKAGDVVRHRGIEAGIVDSVALSSDLSQIEATVTMTPGAAGLAREGARFWIVRPQLSLAGVSGLETAVGAKYIGVSPGDPEASRQSSFDGLSAAPPDENAGDGIDVILRSDAKHGVTVGSPVTWRGVEVGQVLSINLSPDARFVDVHALIRAEYKRLLRTTSQFWVTSGLGIDMGLNGVRLTADSLSTIVRGGVAFATPAVSKDKSPVIAGHMFVLHARPDPDWLSSVLSLPLIDFDLPATVLLQGTRKTTLLGIPRSQKFTANGLLIVAHDNKPQLVTAADVMDTGIEAAATTDSTSTPAASLVVSSPLTDKTFVLEGSTTPTSAEPREHRIVWLPCPADIANFPVAHRDLMRVAQEPEECCLCRTVKVDEDSSSVIQSISREQLTRHDGVWMVTIEAGDLSSWHGAPAVSMLDGRVIGMFVVGKSGAAIVPFAAE